MPLNIPTSPIHFTYNPLYNHTTNNNISLQNLNAPLLVSSVLSGSDAEISSFINYEYEDEELSNMEEGILLPQFTRVFKKNKSNLFSFSFSDKGKRIRKITL